MYTDLLSQQGICNNRALVPFKFLMGNLFNLCNLWFIFIIIEELVVMETCHKALFHHTLMFNVAVVGERLDGNATTRIEQTDDLQILRIHQLDQILHNDVDAVLVEVAVVAEAEEIEFEALAFHHQRARDVINNKVTEVGLTRLGA